MKSMSGRNDQILRDIKEAVRRGHFDRRNDLGPSELERTSVDELLKITATMSRERMRGELARMSYSLHESGFLSNTSISTKRRTQWLSH